MKTIKWLLTIPAAKQVLSVLMIIIVALAYVVVKQDKKLDVANDKIEAAAKICDQEKEALKAGYSDMILSVVRVFNEAEIKRQMGYDSVIKEGKKLLKYSNANIKKLIR